MRYMYLGFLFVSSLWDIRFRKIPAIWLYGGTAWFGIVGIGRIITAQRVEIGFVIALLPGMACYLLAKFTKTMGEGDVWLLLSAGFCYSLEQLLVILSVTFLFSALGGIVVLVQKRRIQNQRIPFAPFLFSAIMLLWIIRGI